MAETTLITLRTTGQRLESFARQTRRWELVSNRLLDLRDALNAAELSLGQWQQKFDVQSGRHVIYLQALFGRMGCEHVQDTLGSISVVATRIQYDVAQIVEQALRQDTSRVSADPNIGYREQIIEDCLRSIRRKTTWSKIFTYRVLAEASDLEVSLERLHRRLLMLERYSDYYLEMEHPEIFQAIRRLPGRRVSLKVGDSHHSMMQQTLLDRLSARKDAELLYRAAGPGSHINIGLSVPKIHRRDFAILHSLNGQTHEVLMHPVKIKAVNDPARIQSDMPTAIPSLIRNTHSPCYMLPSTSTSAGFQVSLPPTNILFDLEHKHPLSTLIQVGNDSLAQQELYPQDQCALSTGITQGIFRLIGSQWLRFLDCRNIRWRRSVAGQWTSMLATVPGDTSITRTLEKCKDAGLQRRDRRDLTKHIHIFRIGLVLTELALKVPISYIEFDHVSATVKIYISGLTDDDEAVDAAEIASEIERRTNLFMGNMAFFCLSVLQDKDAMADQSIEGKYFHEVISQAEQLEALVGGSRRGGSVAGSSTGSGTGTPRRGIGRSATYAY